jgi:Type I phosphodiesterase / nucleotide pyrophosphatase
VGVLPERHHDPTARSRVIVLGVDGFPLEALSPTRTAHLWALGASAGLPPPTGRASLPSSTYPGFASLLTGEHPARHGVWCTSTDRSAPDWTGAPCVALPTLFDRWRAAGLASVAIQGDHQLQRVLRTAPADLRWPDRELPAPDTALDLLGYPTNAAVRPHLLRAVADERLSFVFGHLNETDTRGHQFGPAHPSTLACCTQTDAIVGEVIDTLEPTWSRSLLVVVSDHDMAPAPHLPPVDLLGDTRVRAIVESVWPDGGAVAHVRPGLSPWAARAALLAVNGVAEVDELGPGVLVASTVPVRAFRSQGASAAGFHGSAATEHTLALVGGGHPLANAL